MYSPQYSSPHHFSQMRLATVSFANSPTTIAAIHDFEERNISLISPKGYYYLPSQGEKISLLSTPSSTLAIGELVPDNLPISKGEILIRNDFGAYIKLLANGSVEINSLIISPSGDISKKLSE